MAKTAKHIHYSLFRRKTQEAADFYSAACHFASIKLSSAQFHLRFLAASAFFFLFTLGFS
jgi:hypothetical protein